ncbi:MAG: DUF302 domain-containing protein [Patescibacteria group bacterium]
MSNYGYSKRLQVSFDEAVERAVTALKEQGFGILTDIDVKETLKKKLDVDFKQYRILGACNPPQAYKALQLEEELGLLLPCNVIVYEKDSDVIVSALKPSVAFTIVENTQLESVASEVEQILKQVIDNV